MSDAAATTAEPVSFFRRISLPGFLGGSAEKPETVRQQGGGGGRKWWSYLYRPRVFGFIILVAFMVVRWSDPAWLELLRLKTFDLYQQFKPRPIPKASPVIIVDLDEASLTEVGQWPWPRTQVAKMIRNLALAGSGPIGFDVFFVEEDRLSGKNLVGALPGLDAETAKKLSALKSNDEVFADIIRDSRRVVLGQAVLTEEKDYGDRKGLPTRVIVRGRKGVMSPKDWIPEAPAILRNNKIIEPFGTGHGLVTILPEPDGVVRRVPSFIKHKNRVYPALSIELLRLAANRRNILLTGNNAGIDKVIIKKKALAGGADLDVSTDRNGRMWPYFSRTDKSKYIPAKDVLNGTAPKDKIRGHIVLIGTSAEGLKDIKTIPTERAIPGVEVHAQLIESVLNKQFLSRPAFADTVEMFIALVGGLIVIVLVPWVGAGWAFVAFAVAAVGAGWSSWELFSQQRMLFDAGFAIIAILSIYMYLTVVGFVSEEAERRQTRDAFGKYLSPAMVQAVVEDPSLLTLGGSTREMTLLFCASVDLPRFRNYSMPRDSRFLSINS